MDSLSLYDPYDGAYFLRDAKPVAKRAHRLPALAPHIRDILYEHAGLPHDHPRSKNTTNGSISSNKKNTRIKMSKKERRLLNTLAGPTRPKTSRTYRMHSSTHSNPNNNSLHKNKRVKRGAQTHRISRNVGLRHQVKAKAMIAKFQSRQGPSYARALFEEIRGTCNPYVTYVKPLSHLGKEMQRKRRLEKKLQKEKLKERALAALLSAMRRGSSHHERLIKEMSDMSEEELFEVRIKLLRPVIRRRIQRVEEKRQAELRRQQREHAENVKAELERRNFIREMRKKEEAEKKKQEERERRKRLAQEVLEHKERLAERNYEKLVKMGIEQEKLEKQREEEKRQKAKERERLRKEREEYQYRQFKKEQQRLEREAFAQAEREEQERKEKERVAKANRELRERTERNRMQMELELAQQKEEEYRKQRKEAKAHRARLEARDAMATNARSRSRRNSLVLGEAFGGAKRQAKRLDNQDPLVKASKKGNWEDVEDYLAACKSDQERQDYVNGMDKNGSTGLFHAVWPGHYQVMDILLENKADPNFQNLKRNTALHLACERGHMDVIRLMIRAGADIELENFEGDKCWQKAPGGAKEQETMKEFCQELVEKMKKGEPIDTQMDGWRRRYQENLELEQRIEKKRKQAEDEEAKLNPSMHWLNSKKEISKPAPKNDPLFKAAKRNDVDAIKALVPKPGSSARSKIKARNYVNRIDENGATALSHAVWPGNYEVIQALLAYGADPNICTIKKNSPLHLACERGHLNIITILIRYNADFAIENYQGKMCYEMVQSDSEFTAESMKELLEDLYKSSAEDILDLPNWENLELKAEQDRVNRRRTGNTLSVVDRLSRRRSSGEGRGASRRRSADTEGRDTSRGGIRRRSADTENSNGSRNNSSQLDARRRRRRTTRRGSGGSPFETSSRRGSAGTSTSSVNSRRNSFTSTHSGDSNIRNTNTTTGSSSLLAGETRRRTNRRRGRARRRTRRSSNEDDSSSTRPSNINTNGSESMNDATSVSRSRSRSQSPSRSPSRVRSDSNRDNSHNNRSSTHSIREPSSPRSPRHRSGSRRRRRRRRTLSPSNSPQPQPQPQPAPLSPVGTLPSLDLADDASHHDNNDNPNQNKENAEKKDGDDNNNTDNQQEGKESI